jgi:hypothetical protein
MGGGIAGGNSKFKIKNDKKEFTVHRKRKYRVADRGKERFLVSGFWFLVQGFWFKVQE